MLSLPQVCLLRNYFICKLYIVKNSLYAPFHWGEILTHERLYGECELDYDRDVRFYGFKQLARII